MYTYIKDLGKVLYLILEKLTYNKAGTYVKTILEYSKSGGIQGDLFDIYLFIKPVFHINKILGLLPKAIILRRLKKGKNAN